MHNVPWTLEVSLFGYKKIICHVSIVNGFVMLGFKTGCFILVVFGGLCVRSHVIVCYFLSVCSNCFACLFCLMFSFFVFFFDVACQRQFYLLFSALNT